MSRSNYESYSPVSHSNIVNSQYHGSHVLIGEAPLSDIGFDPLIDMIAQYVGTRDPGSCPQIDELLAVPDTSLIRTTKRQSLRVPCAARQQVLGADTDSAASYSACSIRVGRIGLDLADLSAEWLANPDKKQMIECPFVSLDGVIASAEIRVEVTVSAYNPVPTDPFQAK